MIPGNHPTLRRALVSGKLLSLCAKGKHVSSEALLRHLVENTWRKSSVHPLEFIWLYAYIPDLAPLTVPISKNWDKPSQTGQTHLSCLMSELQTSLLCPCRSAQIRPAKQGRECKYLVRKCWTQKGLNTTMCLRSWSWQWASLQY